MPTGEISTILFVNILIPVPKVTHFTILNLIPLFLQKGNLWQWSMTLATWPLLGPKIIKIPAVTLFCVKFCRSVHHSLLWCYVAESFLCFVLANITIIRIFMEVLHNFSLFGNCELRARFFEAYYDPTA